MKQIYGKLPEKVWKKTNAYQKSYGRIMYNPEELSKIIEKRNIFFVLHNTYSSIKPDNYPSPLVCRYRAQ